MVRTTGLTNYSDAHFTDPKLARLLVHYFKPTLPCLDPCMGNGAFFHNMPEGSEWCELNGISERCDFFDRTARVNWIITNPPFSNLTMWMSHAFSLADNVVFLMPLSKLFSSAPRMSLVRKYGCIREVVYLGSGRDIGFDLGFPFAAVHFRRKATGSIKWTWLEESDHEITFARWERRLSLWDSAS